MMYIRTKDGVYEVDENSKGTEDFLWVKTNKANIVQCVWLNCIIAQSETIEELCDEGVTEVKFGSTGYIAHFNKNIDDLRKFLKYLKECQPITKDEILNVYGAIWTEWGLKYVAKMNEKGELELI